jgi:hypothetical protein
MTNNAFVNNSDFNDTTFVNLTPHEINVVLDDEIKSFSKSGTIARVSEESTLVAWIGGCPIFESKWGDVIDLPEAEEGIVFIVSAMVRSAVPNRRDVVSPGNPVRDAEGRVIGCRGFVRNKI